MPKIMYMRPRIPLNVVQVIGSYCCRCGSSLWTTAIFIFFESGKKKRSLFVFTPIVDYTLLNVLTLLKFFRHIGNSSTMKKITVR